MWGLETQFIHVSDETVINVTFSKVSILTEKDGILTENTVFNFLPAILFQWKIQTN